VAQEHKVDAREVTSEADHTSCKPEAPVHLTVRAESAVAGLALTARAEMTEDADLLELVFLNTPGIAYAGPTQKQFLHVQKGQVLTFQLPATLTQAGAEVPVSARVNILGIRPRRLAALRVGAELAVQPATERTVTTPSGEVIAEVGP